MFCQTVRIDGHTHFEAFFFQCIIKILPLYLLRTKSVPIDFHYKTQKSHLFTSDDNHSVCSYSTTNTHTATARLYDAPPVPLTQQKQRTQPEFPWSSRKGPAEDPERSGVGTKCVWAARIVWGPLPTPVLSAYMVLSAGLLWELHGNRVSPPS